MKKAAMVLATVALLSGGAAVVHAQVAPVVPILIPSPLGIVLSVGTWIYNLSGDPVYYIEVQGQGRNIEESRKNGFRLAVENAMGSVVASDTKVRNDRIQYDEIISYASGRIDKYEVIKIEDSGGLVKTNMKVWVRKSLLANRLLGDSRSDSTVDGDRAAVAIDSIKTERQDGAALMTAMMRDFPRGAFKTKITGNEITMSPNGYTGTLNVTYTVNWQDTWLDAFWEASRSTASKTGKLCLPFTDCQRKVYDSWLTIDDRFGSRTAWYDDTDKAQIVKSALNAGRPQTKITLLNDQNQPIYSQCTPTGNGELYQNSAQQWPVINNKTYRGYAAIDGLTPEELKQVREIEIKVVSPSQCSPVARQPIRTVRARQCGRNTGYVQDLAGGSPEC